MPEKSTTCGDFSNNTNHALGVAHQIRPVHNQLHFHTNVATILPYLARKVDEQCECRRFSLNSIVKLPNSLILPLNHDIVRLSLLNIDALIFDDRIRWQFLSNWTAEYIGKQPRSIILEKITEIETRLLASQFSHPELDILERAVTNYKLLGFFCQVDWCMIHWGTVADIEEVTASTFNLPTSCLEFQTRSTPPIIAMQQLANTFPSVSFTLLYRYPPESAWHEVQFYPSPPFGY